MHLFVNCDAQYAVNVWIAFANVKVGHSVAAEPVFVVSTPCVAVRTSGRTTQVDQTG